MKLTVLMEDRTETAELSAEHGLSFFVEARGTRILFDCGQSGAVIGNAEKLGVDLKSLDAVILSHGHYDHARGFPALAQAGLGGKTLYTGPGFFREKYSKTAEGYADRACGFRSGQLRQWGISHRVADGVTELTPGIYLISGFPRKTEYEKIPEKFVLRTEDGFIPDPFTDEICMAVEENGGLVLLVGCSHPGIVNMTAHVGKVLGKPVNAIYGGVHLLEAGDTQIAATLTDLQALGVRELGLCHCSGQGVHKILEGIPEIKSRKLTAGSRILF